MALDTFPCHLCSKRTDTQGNLNKYLNTHTKPFVCETCKRGFALCSVLNRHIKSKHRTGNQQYRCHFERCAFTSNRKDNLKRHQRKKHSSRLLGSPVETSDESQSSHQQYDHIGSVQLYSASNFMRVAASGDLVRLKAFLGAGLTIQTVGRGVSRTGRYCLPQVPPHVCSHALPP